MTLEEIKAAVEAGKTVHWGTLAYRVIKDNLGQFLVQCPSTGGCWGLTWADGKTLNGKPEEFFVAKDACEEVRRRELLDLARDRLERDGEIEFDDDAKVSESEDNGAYVQAWLWVSFAGTQFDKERDEPQVHPS